MAAKYPSLYTVPQAGKVGTVSIAHYGRCSKVSAPQFTAAAAFALRPLRSSRGVMAGDGAIATDFRVTGL